MFPAVWIAALFQAVVEIAFVIELLYCYHGSRLKVIEESNTLNNPIVAKRGLHTAILFR